MEIMVWQLAEQEVEGYAEDLAGGRNCPAAGDFGSFASRLRTGREHSKDGHGHGYCGNVDCIGGKG